MRQVKLYISIPSCRDWKVDFGSSMMGLTSHLFTRGIAGCEITGILPCLLKQASCLPQARQIALNNAIAGGFTHWLSLDDDHGFPPDILDGMVAHGKDVVTANYRRKQGGAVGVCMGLDGRLLDSTGKTGLEEIGWMGGGMFLADIEKIKNIPAPHFEVRWSEAKRDYFDQDNYFSAILRQNGCEIWCDHDLSQRITHIGDHAYAWPQGETA